MWLIYGPGPTAGETDLAKTMIAKSKPKANKPIIAKAQIVLEFAEQRAKHVTDWLELHFALYGEGGKASELFTDGSKRRAFSRVDVSSRRTRSPMPGVVPPTSSSRRNARSCGSM